MSLNSGATTFWIRRYNILGVVSIEGEQNMKPLNVPLWHEDYSKQQKARKTQQIQEIHLPFPKTSKNLNKEPSPEREQLPGMMFF